MYEKFFIKVGFQYRFSNDDTEPTYKTLRFSFVLVEAFKKNQIKTKTLTNEQTQCTPKLWSLGKFIEMYVYKCMFENPVLKEVHFSYGTVFNDTSFNENTLLKYRDNVNKYMYIFC